MSGHRTAARPAVASGRDAEPHADDITVDVRDNLVLQDDEAAALDLLVAGQPRTGVFMSRAWLSGYFEEPPAGIEPCVLVFTQGAAIRGMLPIAVTRATAHVRVSVLGGGLGSDRVDLLAFRGYEAACADRLIAWLGERFGATGFVLELRDVVAHSPLWGAVARHAAGSALVLQPHDVHPVPYLDLAEQRSLHGGGLAAEPFLRTIARHRRWLENRGRLRIDVLDDPADVAASFDSLVQLLSARWQGREQPSVLDAPAARRFHTRVLPRLLDAGHLRMIRFTCDLRTIAVFYGLACGRSWSYYLLGYDREWAGRIHLGRFALATAIELAAQHGASEFDFLKGAEGVKYLWSVRERATIDADVYSTRPGPQLVRAVRASRHVAAAVAKSVRGLRPARLKPDTTTG